MPDVEVPSPCETHRLDASCPVKRFCNRRTPVDDQRFEVLVGHGDPADVKRLAILSGWRRRGVDPSEAQCLVPDVQLLEPGEGGVDDDVALGACLKGAATPDVDDVADHRPRLIAHRVECDMGSVEVALFLGDLALL
jgi:hypothetical protein